MAPDLRDGIRVSRGRDPGQRADGHPAACVQDAAFAYVNAFTANVNVGFLRGAELADPDGLLEGTGKMMRHVKLRPDSEIDLEALSRLIKTAYADMKGRLGAG